MSFNKKHTPESRARMSASRREYWTPERRAERSRQMTKRAPLRITYREHGKDGVYGRIVEQLEIPADVTEIIVVDEELTFVFGDPDSGTATEVCIYDVPDEWVKIGETGPTDYTTEER